MAKFKTGQLVMVVKETDLPKGMHKGMIGEVIRFPPGPYSKDVTADISTAVLLPSLPSNSISKAWGFRDSELIAINDPDSLEEGDEREREIPVLLDNLFDKFERVE